MATESLPYGVILKCDTLPWRFMCAPNGLNCNDVCDICYLDRYCGLHYTVDVGW